MNIGIRLNETAEGDYVMVADGRCTDVIYRIKSVKEKTRRRWCNDTLKVEEFPVFVLAPVLQMGLAHEVGTVYAGKRKLANRSVDGADLLKLDVLMLCKLRAQIDLIINQIAAM